MLVNQLFGIHTLLDTNPFSIICFENNRLQESVATLMTPRLVEFLLCSFDPVFGTQNISNLHIMEGRGQSPKFCHQLSKAMWLKIQEDKDCDCFFLLSFTHWSDLKEILLGGWNVFGICSFLIF